MRPVYETRHDRDEEWAAIRPFAERYGLVATKARAFSGFDFSCSRNGKVVGYVEVKRRRNPMRKYPTFAVSMRKVKAARRLTLPAVFLIRWDDALGFVRADKPDFTRNGGRSDRGDAADHERMAHFRIERFQVIGGP